MIIKRKLFSADYKNFDNRLGVSEFRVPEYKPFGPWKVDTVPAAKLEYSNFEPATKNKIDRIKEHISKSPTMIGGPYRQHPLWDYYDKLKNEFVIWSADITKEDRLVYLIF